MIKKIAHYNALQLTVLPTTKTTKTSTTKNNNNNNKNNNNNNNLKNYNSSVVIGLRNSYFPIIHLSSCYRREFSDTLWPFSLFSFFLFFLSKRETDYGTQHSFQRIWSFCVVILQRTTPKCTNNYYARAQPSHILILNLVFSDVTSCWCCLNCRHHRGFELVSHLCKINSP